MSLPAENIREIQASAVAVVTPMEMLNRAVSSGASLEMVEKLMTLQERWEAGQARKAFDEAIAGAKAEIPPIQRNAKGHNDKRYADFAAIAKVVDPILSRHGLSYRFRTAQGERISVTCVLSHKSGHSEETTLSGPADASGSKNAIQAIGSTLTYLQRYSLVQMLGLAASNDDDGKAGGDGEMISQDQVEQLIALADEVGADKRAFCQYFKVEGIAQLPAKEFNRAVAALNKKRGAK
ncbi:ERF family protein [Bradyrhizobium elkanii]|nr:ERF family protein [Bradyrhizobium elkanii]